MPAYHSQSAEEVCRELNTTPKGLTTAQAQERLDKYGPNVLRTKQGMYPLKLLIDQFTSPIVWILIAAMAVSAYIDEWISVYVILAIVIINAVLGFTQEYRAGKAIAHLKKLLSLKAHVLRDEKVIEIDATRLVPGDIVLVQTGVKIGADCRIVEATNLRTEQAALTGESMPTPKGVESMKKNTVVADRKSMLFASTLITSGRGKGVVTATGMNTEIGKIAKFLQQTVSEPTPLQKKLARLAKILGVLVLALAAIMLAVGVAAGKPLYEMSLTAVALAVAAIPEGLPAVVTTALAIGVQRMARRKALVRKLPSAETLGACTVICADKTGTFTHNEMTVRKLFVNREVINVTGSGYSPIGRFSRDPKEFALLLRIGALNNDAQVTNNGESWSVTGDPTEAALTVSARKAGINPEKLNAAYPRIKEAEFTSERKRMTTVHRIDGGTVAYVKGAPEILLKRCTRMWLNGREIHLGKDDRERILDINNRFAANALRVIGFAYRRLEDGQDDLEKYAETDMVFVGLQAMMDPPRAEVRAAVRKCTAAGIRVVMITGDYLGTAKAIADDLGITGKTMTGEELMRIKNLEDYVDDISVYARVDPMHKLRIVEALKRKGHIVAMTGDGVNDAPALKRADIGIAMGITGTDVAKDASAMVLVDDNFTSIVAAIEEGRTIFDNIKKFVEYLLSSNMGEVLTLFVAIAFGLPLPILPLQLLWINLATDGLPALALGVEPKEPGLMNRPPRKTNEHVVNHRRGIMIGIIGGLMASLTLGTFMLYDPGANPVLAQTMAFNVLVLLQMFNVLNQRSETQSLFSLGIFSNKFLWGAIGISVALQVVVIQLPFFNTILGTTALNMAQWLICLGVSSLILVFGEMLKFLQCHA